MLPTMRSGNRGDTGVRRLSDLRYEMDRMFDDLLRTPQRGVSGWTPATNLVERDDRYEVTMELPGFDRDGIDVTVDQGVLTISGRRVAEEEREDETYHLRERSLGRFSRSFSLPSSVNASDVSAHYENGILTVDLPKAPEAKTRKIEVDVG